MTRLACGRGHPSGWLLSFRLGVSGDGQGQREWQLLGKKADIRTARMPAWSGNDKQQQLLRVVRRLPVEYLRTLTGLRLGAGI